KEEKSGFNAYQPLHPTRKVIKNGKEEPDVDAIVYSSDPNFRPWAVKRGPDAAIYFSDWHNPIIGHMQHNLRDPNRNRVYGRVYRITYDGAPLSKSPKIDGATIEQLLENLKNPEDR